MKLTPPQKRLLDMIVTVPVAAQDEINDKLSARNVVANLVKVGALAPGLGFTCNGTDYEVTDDGLTALGYDPTKMRAAMNETVEVVTGPESPLEVYDAVTQGYVTEFKERTVRPALIKDQMDLYPDTPYAGTDDRGPIAPTGGLAEWAERIAQMTGLPELAARQISSVAVLDQPLPMPEIEPADEPIAYVPVELVNPTVMPERWHLSSPERVPEAGPVRLIVGTQTKNEHRATENNETRAIVCECGVRTRSRKLLGMLHQTTRKIPYVREV